MLNEMRVPIASATDIVIARQQGRGLAEVAGEAGADVLGGPSLKAALDLDWDDPAAREQALALVLHTLEAVASWVDAQPAAGDPLVASSLAIAHQVQAQDVRPNDAGQPGLGQGVARDRRISVEDGQMRHGRKSRHQRVDGYKRQVLYDRDMGVVRAVGLTPANAPEAGVTTSILEDLQAQGVSLADREEGHIDRAYLTSAVAGGLQGLAGSQSGPLPHNGLHPRLGAADATLPSRGRDALCAGRGRALPCSDLCRLPAAGPLYCQPPWAQRPHPCRRAAPA